MIEDEEEYAAVLIATPMTPEDLYRQDQLQMKLDARDRRQALLEEPEIQLRVLSKFFAAFSSLGGEA